LGTTKKIHNDQGIKDNAKQRGPQAKTTVVKILNGPCLGGSSPKRAKNKKNSDSFFWEKNPEGAQARKANFQR